MGCPIWSDAAIPLVLYCLGTHTRVMSSEETGDRQRAIMESASENGFNRTLGFTIEVVGEDWVRASVPHDREFVNENHDQAMHGGVAASALDAVTGYAVMAQVYDNPDRTIGPTINLNVNYVSTSSEPLIAYGEVVRLTAQNAIGEGRIEGANTGKLVAKGQGVWRVFAP